MAENTTVERLTNQETLIRIALMEQNITNTQNIFGRLESAIEKIGGVSVDITKMLAVHDERIETMQNVIIHNKANSVMSNESVSRDIKELHSRITTTNREMTDLLHASEGTILEHQNTSESKIMAGQAELKEYFMKHTDAIEKRVKTLENWRYVLVGIFLVLGVLVSLVAQNRVSINTIVP